MGLGGKDPFKQRGGGGGGVWDAHVRSPEESGVVE